MTQEQIKTALEVAENVFVEQMLEEMLGDAFFVNAETGELSDTKYALFYDTKEEEYFFLEYATDSNGWHETAEQQNYTWAYITHISPADAFNGEFDLKLCLTEIFQA